MNVITFIIRLSFLYTLIYITCTLLGIWALIYNYFSGEQFLNLLTLIGSFLSIFFGTLYTFLERIKTKDTSTITHKFTSIYTTSVFITVIALGLALIFGIFLDISNIGFTKEIYFDMYYLIVQGSLGVYSGNIIDSVFSHVNNLSK